MKNRSLFALCAALILNACSPEQGANHSSTANDSEALTTSTEQRTESRTKPLIADQQLLNPDSPTPTTELASSNKAAGPADQIVAEMGFASAQDIEDTFLTNGDSQKPKYSAHCSTYSDDMEATLPKLDAKELDAIAKTFCKKIANRLASVSNEICLAAQLRPTGCDSNNGVPLMLREFPPLDNRVPKGRVLVIGGTHGDELTSVSVIFRWIEKLNKHHSGLFHWHVMPSLNPDGLLKRSAQRTNQNGVDINRNMPSLDWTQNALDYWERKGNKNPRKYPGASANSEPETNWLVDEIELFKPDAIIAVHAPYGVVDFDARKLKTAPKSLGKLHLNLLGTYPGSLGNYAGMNLNIPVITLELPHSWEMPSQRETDLIWQDLVSWLKKNLHREKAALAE